MGQNIITLPGRVSENLALYRVRAKYIPLPDGTLRLASVCQFSQPVFNPYQLEQVIPEDPLDFGLKLEPEEVSEESRELYRERATRRAKTAAFDLVICNPDLNVFATLTYDPQYVDRASWEDCYGKLKVWLSNRVSRYGFKYVCVPEHHKDGESIHFHMICNDRGLKLVDSGHFRHGERIWNIRSWKWGFSTALYIGKDETDRDKVSKYIYKYMGKQVGQKIGGRYYLHGGQLTKPEYLYGDDPQLFFGADQPKWHREVEITSATRYDEWSFI